MTNVLSVEVLRGETSTSCFMATVQGTLLRIEELGLHLVLLKTDLMIKVEGRSPHRMFLHLGLFLLVIFLNAAGLGGCSLHTFMPRLFRLGAGVW